MKHRNAPAADKIDEWESNYAAFTDMFFHFLHDAFDVFDEEKLVSESDQKNLERQLFISLSSLEKMHYHFFHQKEALEEHYFITDTAHITWCDKNADIKKETRRQIMDLKKHIQQRPFLSDSLKNRCLDHLHLLLSYYPKLTIIQDTSPQPPWLSIHT